MELNASTIILYEIIMLVSPCAKLNLGLNVVERRADGYHNLETVFIPVPLYDALEINVMDERFPSETACDIKISGNKIDCEDKDNIIVKAYNIIASDYDIPRIHVHLFKNIPSQAGLGGGSSDAAYMLRALDDLFGLNIGNHRLKEYAARLGADCAFFIDSKPAFATGIGSCLTPVNMATTLAGYYVVIIKPSVAISTKEAYAHIHPHYPEMCCCDIVGQPVETWKDLLSNDFEEQAFKDYPELQEIKNTLYSNGAVYAQMSGSGSAMFGLFKEHPYSVESLFKHYYTTTLKLQY